MIYPSLIRLRLNRLPVQTEIIDFSENVIKDAINEEIERGGQVFLYITKWRIFCRAANDKQNLPAS